MDYKVRVNEAKELEFRRLLEAWMGLGLVQSFEAMPEKDGRGWYAFDEAEDEDEQNVTERYKTTYDDLVD